MNTAIRIHQPPRNPFRPGMGLEPPYLADRVAVAFAVPLFGEYLRRTVHLEAG